MWGTLLGRVRGAALRASNLGMPSVRSAVAKGSPKRLCTTAADAAASEGSFSRLLREGQVDSGMWQGAGILVGVILGVQLSSQEQRDSAVSSLLGVYRSCGLSDVITDRNLVEDFVRKNIAAAANVLMASPVFYFVFAKIHQESFLVSSIRAVTGTLRIVPFMGFFYGFMAFVAPFFH